MKRVFYSFQYDGDVMRVQQIRNIHAIDEESKPVTPTKWEEVKRGGDAAIREWIDRNIERASCVVVLIGEKTSESKWVRYEISNAWDKDKGLIGIYVNNLRDPRSGTSQKGKNPFDNIILNDGTVLSSYVKTYEPNRHDAYGDISNNLQKWVEEATTRL